MRGSTVATTERSAEGCDGREGKAGGRAKKRESWKGMRGITSASLVQKRGDFLLNAPWACNERSTPSWRTSRTSTGRADASP